MNKRKVFFQVLLVTFTTVTLTTCTIMLYGCNDADVSSRWRQGDITIDGDAAEWKDILVYHEEQKIAVGLQNDADNLYICLKTLDRDVQRKVVMAGLTVWFDPKGGDDKKLGIHFPLGLMASGNPIGDMPRQGSRGSEQSQDVMRQQFTDMLNEIEIIGPGKVDLNRISTLTSFKQFGIKVAMKDTIGMLVYELVIPLKETDKASYAIQTEVGKTIGIGLETGELKRPETGGGMGGGGGRSGGGMGGMGGGGRRSGGGMGGRSGGGETMSPLKLWAKVKLAAGNMAPSK
jgi:uncharacterized membrane protein YgcG